jgi:hypothetical protein
MWLQIGAVAVLVGIHVYHRWVEDWLFPPEVKPPPIDEVRIPRTDDGAAVPLIYGRVRVDAPLLVWHSPVSYEGEFYHMDMFFVLGIGFGNGYASQKMYDMWAGDTKLIHSFSEWTDLTGDGNYEAPIIVGYTWDDGDFTGGMVEFLNGNSAQMIVDNSDAPVTYVGERMMDYGLAAIDCPGYRGYLSIYLFHVTAGARWYTGKSLSIPKYSWEVASWNTGHPQLGTYARVGDDSNPINVLYDLLAAKFGKAGVESYVDMTSFQAAQYTLHTETHGYSIVIQKAVELDNHITDVLKQIDATLYEDAADGKLKIKLIRNDYDPLTIPHITKSNGAELVNFAIGGWSDIPNKLKLIFTNRADEYRDGTAYFQNLANVNMQDGQVIEHVIRMPGVTSQSLANAIIAREGAAICRPTMKCSVLVDRSFLRTNIGDAVKVTWDQPDIPGLVFRVAAVDRGMLADNKIRLDLIQDYFYVWRNLPPKSGDFGDLGDDAPTDIGIGV